MKKQRIATVLVFLALVGAGAPSALANPNNEQYGNELGQQFEPPTTTRSSTPTTTTPSTTKPAPAVTTTSGGTLPFTGMDLAVVAAIGGGAVVGGVGLRKLGRKRDQQS